MNELNEVNEVNGQVNDQVDNESVGSDTIELDESAIGTSGTKWFHPDACTACAEGLNQRMQELIDGGMSQRKASEVMSEECSGELSSDTIRKRYAYYRRVSNNGKVGKTSHLNNDVNGGQVGKTSHPMSSQDGQPEVSTHPQLPDL